MRAFLVFFLALLFSWSGLTQQYNFISYTVEDGLAQNQVFSIVQDDQGYLWFATAGGLSRFDGIEFINYAQRDGIFRNQIQHLYKDVDGNIWIASIGGVTRYDGEEFKSFAFKADLSSTKVNCTVQDQEGTMWFGTNEGGLVYLKGGQLHYLEQAQGLKDNTVRTLYLDGQGTIWVGTRGGINHIRDGGIYDFALDEEGYDANVRHITGSSNGEIWISTFRDGVFHIVPPNVDQITVEEDSLVAASIRQTLVADDGSVWFVSIDGLSEYRNGSIVENYDMGNGMSYTSIRCATQDNEGNLWFGTDGKGILKFSGKAFTNFTVVDGLESDQVMSVAEDHRGDLWFGTYTEGVIRYDGQSFSILEELPSDRVWSCLVDSQDKLWIGTHTGLYLRDIRTGAFSDFDHLDSTKVLQDGKVTAIYESRDGTLWFGTRLGISKFNSDTSFTNYSVEEGFEGTSVRDIEEDANGNLWCGSENGIFIFNPSAETTIKVELGVDVGETKIFSLVKDARDQIWAGTDNGLYHQDPGGSFSYMSLGPDARSNFINFILPDEESIWVGTNYGIYQIISQDNALPVIRSYTSHEGIKNLECNLNAAFVDKHGYYWFGTAGGLVRLDKSKLSEQRKALMPVSIRSINLFQDETDWSIYGEIDPQTSLPKNLSLAYNKNHLTFDFILFNYSNPEGVLYKYKLVGYDQEWSLPSHATNAVYKKLPPGDYEFVVMARTSNGQWSEPTTFSFTIKPPFWNTWWFFTLCAVGALCLAGAAFIWRKSVNRRKRETEELKYKNKLLALEHQSLNASLNRHFIFNALNSIQYYINRQDRISANKYLSRFAKLIRKNLDSSSSGNNYVTLSEEMERIELYLNLEHMRFQNKFEYEIIYKTNIDTEAVMVPAMMLQPFIENSIWHGILPMEKPGKITLTLDRAKNSDIKFEIMDNGIGIDNSLKKKLETGSTHDSKGMKITSGRIDLLKTITRKNISLNGPYQLTDETGNSLGTKVEIILPANTMETFL